MKKKKVKEFDCKKLIKILTKINTYGYDKIDLLLGTIEQISVHAQIVKDQRLAHIIDECISKFEELSKKSEKYIRQHKEEVSKM